MSYIEPIQNSAITIVKIGIIDVSEYVLAISVLGTLYIFSKIKGAKLPSNPVTSAWLN